MTSAWYCRSDVHSPNTPCRSSKAWLLVLMTAAFGMSLVPHAAEAFVTPEEQYKSYLTKAQSITPLTEFGDQVSLRDGKLSFKAVDLEVPGTGPTIRILRSTTLDDGRSSDITSGNRFGIWEIELPRIKTVTANPTGMIRGHHVAPESPTGWQVPAVDKDARCTNFGMPGHVTYTDSSIEFMTYSWWFGYQLVGLDGDERTLIIGRSGLPNPQYKIGTSDNWVVSCLPSTANGKPGEAFLAVSPDGTKYWLDYLVYRSYDTLYMDFELDGSTYLEGLPRRGASMLVTRVEDRFGNWLAYDYTAGVLDSISASDGRLVTFTRNADGMTITVGTGSLTRSWAYTYDATAQLLQVAGPDGASWRYSGNFGGERFSPYSFEGCSQVPSGTPTGTRQVSVTAPSGATATFVLDRRIFGRSYVPKYCIGASQLSPNAGFAMYPRLWIGYAITSKTISGPGLGSQTWQYEYSPYSASWASDCGAGCADTVWADVIAPDGKRIRSTFSSRWDQTENKLLREDTYAPNNALVASTQYEYATTPSNVTNPYLWPLKIGSYSGYWVNEEVNTRWTPLKKRTIHQDGRTFVWRVADTCTGSALCFDALARPIKVVKESSP
jgi:hypothetical protein